MIAPLTEEQIKSYYTSPTEKLAAQVNEMMNESESEDNEEVLEENTDAMDNKAENEENASVEENADATDSKTVNEENASSKDDKVTANKAKLENPSKKSDENEPYLINMEEDDPFEIEFVDLNDGDDTK